MTESSTSFLEESYSSLLRGIQELDLCGPGIPSDLVLIGDHAFPLTMNTRGQVLMAASTYGRGRLVVLGHESYLTTLPKLVDNALAWLSADPAQDHPSVGIHPSCSALVGQIGGGRMETQVGPLTQGLGVYVTNVYSVMGEEKGLVEFMKTGGGLLLGGQAWSWAQCNPGQNTLLNFPGNHVSSVAGVYFSEHLGERECLPVPPQIPSSWMAVAIEKDFKDDLEFLLKGVSEFHIQGGAVPSEVLVHGPLAFPIGSAHGCCSFLAGAYYGQGRVIVVSHEGYLNHVELATFWKNAVRWLDEGRNGLVGLIPGLDPSLLSQSGLTCEQTGFRKDLSVYVCMSYGEQNAELVQQFVAEGGGLLIGGHAWWWSSQNPGRNVLTDYPGNRILNRMGLSLLGDTVPAGCYPAPTPGQSRCHGYHFRQLLRRFASHVNTGEELTPHEEACLQKLGKDCAMYLNMQAYDCSAYNTVLSSLTDILKQSAVPQVCQSCPVSRPKDHLLLQMGAEVYKVCPDPDALLPYLVKDQPVRAVVYNASIPIRTKTGEAHEWISTGLYLSPGMRTYMAMPPQIVNKGWKVQIGCQTDYIGNASELRRAPSVCQNIPVDSEMMQVWNLWGGLIYLVAPAQTEVDGAEVIVQVAVPAPYYKSGVTTLADWMILRNAPSPWAELEFENIILTVHSDVVRGLERPDEVAALWDDIMRGVADLAAVPPKLIRKERFVADVQISHGFMHAGYPIMIQSCSAAELLDVKLARSSGIWGAIHELGHNQQKWGWGVPPNTTECTCNLWSVYVHEQVLGVDRGQAHPNMTLVNRNCRAEQYAKGGRNLGAWDMWTALETYMQLQDVFGWEAFKKVFARYHTMQNVPGDNPGKMNLYACTFSQVVEKNLASFFKAWGWPIDAATEEKLSSLPAWTDHPMAQYG